MEMYVNSRKSNDIKGMLRYGDSVNMTSYMLKEVYKEMYK